mmetsp:Transcript_62343/g.138861  ORF Transcript_62343/g.138861 Transcript_62343/m.138861 type:complete len:108 (+) Transcript_62343:1499-1822(+)
MMISAMPKTRRDWLCFMRIHVHVLARDGKSRRCAWPESESKLLRNYHCIMDHLNHLHIPLAYIPDPKPATPLCRPASSLQAALRQRASDFAASPRFALRHLGIVLDR